VTRDRLIHRAPVFAVEMVEDLPFGQSRTAQGQSKTWTLDLYRPDEDSGRSRPAILWFHGGGFNTHGDNGRDHRENRPVLI
jgi:acetyl esterase/lipase